MKLFQIFSLRDFYFQAISQYWYVVKKKKLIFLFFSFYLSSFLSWVVIFSVSIAKWGVVDFKNTPPYVLTQLFSADRWHFHIVCSCVYVPKWNLPHTDILEVWTPYLYLHMPYSKIDHFHPTDMAYLKIIFSPGWQNPALDNQKYLNKRKQSTWRLCLIMKQVVATQCWHVKRIISLFLITSYYSVFQAWGRNLFKFMPDDCHIHETLSFTMWEGTI